jgi:hypothetical protein
MTLLDATTRSLCVEGAAPSGRGHLGIDYPGSEGVEGVTQEVARMFEIKCRGYCRFDGRTFQHRDLAIRAAQDHHADTVGASAGQHEPVVVEGRSGRGGTRSLSGPRRLRLG